MSKSGIVCVVLLLCMLPFRAFAHQGHVQQAPWKVCKMRQLGHACSWQDGHHNIYEGTCQQVSSSLMCVRNRPIRKAILGEASNADRHTTASMDKTPKQVSLKGYWVIPVVLMILGGILVGVPYCRQRT